MKYYQTVTTATTTCDEWIYYEGYDKEEAFKQCAHEKSHNDKIIVLKYVNTSFPTIVNLKI